ncbi:MAG: type III-B CRISPR module RAMP protein Cmr6 [Atribacterota bacterium]|nr:type III-B CRISPR module RAMP protein Cmr6 [Atribacterota bacterium]
MKKGKSEKMRINNKNAETTRPGRGCKFYNPSDTANILRNVIRKKDKYEERRGKKEVRDWFYESTQQTVINPALAFGKLIPYAVSNESSSGRDDPENKHKYLEFVVGEIKKIKESNAGNFLKSILKRQQEWQEKLSDSGWVVDSGFTKRTSWRLIVGLGSSHPQETSMTLHHNYGIPYIPGSAIKGATRHWFILSNFEKLRLPMEQIKCFEKILSEADLKNENEDKRDDKLSIKDLERKFRVDNLKPDDLLLELIKEQKELISLFQDIFGTQQQKGNVIFFDAYPDGNINLKIDIMNPHYPEYYSGSQAPTDWQQPKPIKFLTVENTDFYFRLASRNQTLLQEAKTLLKDALENYGVGAKTSLGYGVFL